MRGRFERYKTSLAVTKDKIMDGASSLFQGSTSNQPDQDKSPAPSQLPPENVTLITVNVPAREVPPCVPDYTQPKNNMVAINTRSCDSTVRVVEGNNLSSTNGSTDSSNPADLEAPNYPPPPALELPRYLSTLLEEESYIPFETVDSVIDEIPEVNAMDLPKNNEIEDLPKETVDPQTLNDVSRLNDSINSNPFIELINQSTVPGVSNNSSFFGFAESNRAPDNRLAAAISDLENEINITENHPSLSTVSQDQRPSSNSAISVMSSPRSRRPPPAAFNPADKRMMVDLKRGHGMFSDYSSVSILFQILKLSYINISLLVDI